MRYEGGVTEDDFRRRGRRGAAGASEARPRALQPEAGAVTSRGVSVVLQERVERGGAPPL